MKGIKLYNNWQPIHHEVLRDSNLKEIIHTKGYAVIPFLGKQELSLLNELYHKEHSIQAKEGAMFYTLYSKDIDYRKRVHISIATLLEPIFEKHFHNYKNIVNIFINKISGSQSGFYTHQDTTALDEFKYSPLSIWIPLQDITPENGALGVIEKSHWFFSPYRSITIPFPFGKINSTVKNYLKPIYLKAGEALVFDPRIIHNSFTNSSGKDRIVVLCGIFPKEADFITCFKDNKEGSKIELLQHPDSFILENETFYYDCHTRPKSGNLIREVQNDFPDMDAETFEKLCELNHIQRQQEPQTTTHVQCEFIAEPDGVNKFEKVEIQSNSNSSLWKKIKTVFQ